MKLPPLMIPASKLMRLTAIADRALIRLQGIRRPTAASKAAVRLLACMAKICLRHYVGTLVCGDHACARSDGMTQFQWSRGILVLDQASSISGIARYVDIGLTDITLQVRPAGVCQPRCRARHAGNLLNVAFEIAGCHCSVRPQMLATVSRRPTYRRPDAPAYSPDRIGLTRHCTGHDTSLAWIPPAGDGNVADEKAHYERLFIE